jgi:TRAP-type C4-dicarboxylate transport system substrate-binding protein
MRKKMNKLVVLLVLLGFMVVPLFGAGGQADSSGSSGAAAPKAKKELVMAHHNSKTSLVGQGQDRVAEIFNKNCSTAYITVYHNSELGTINQLLEAVSVGTIDINANGFGQSSTLYKPMELFDMPYLVKSSDDAVKLMDLDKNPILKEILSEFEKVARVHVVAVSPSVLARHLTCNFPVYKPSDLKGIKVRSITSDVFTLAVQGLGAVAVPIDWSETPTSLATHVIEGQENPYNTLSDYKLWDVQKYVMETGHIYGSGLYMVNENTWNNMTAEERSALEFAFKDTIAWERDINLKQLEQYKQNCINGGMTIITAKDGLDVDAFKENTLKLLKEKYPQYTDYFSRLDEYLGYK